MFLLTSRRGALALAATSFLLSSTAVSPLRIVFPHLPAFSCSGFRPLFLLPPPAAFPRTPPTAGARRCPFSSASSSCHLTMNRSAASRTPLYTTSPPSSLQWTTARSQLRTPRGHPSLAQNSSKVFGYASIPSLKLPPRSRVLPTSHRSEHYPTG